MLNSRLKDYYDLYSLSQECDVTPAAISKAIDAIRQLLSEPLELARTS